MHQEPAERRLVGEVEAAWRGPVVERAGAAGHLAELLARLMEAAAALAPRPSAAQAVAARAV